MKLRARRLANEPFCRDCKEQDGLLVLATVPDHILPLAQGGEDVDENVRCLCDRHHRIRTAEQFGTRAPRPEIGLDGWPIE